MKKVLALIVAFALCITVFAGCFATSAAAVADSFKVVGSTVEAAGGAATVTVSGAYDAKTVQLLTVTLPADVTFVSVNGMTQLTADGTEGDYVVNGQVIKFLTIADSTFEIVINVTVPANETTEDVTYDVAAVVEFAAWNDTAVSNDTANGVITVKAKVVEPEGPVLDENIVFNGVAVTITETLNVRFQVTKTLVSQYASAAVVVNPTVYSSGNKVPGTTVKLPLTTGTTKNWRVVYEDIGMFMLDLPLSVYVECYDANGEVVAYSNTYEYLPGDLLKAQYSATPANDDAVKLNAIVTDMLNMSAKAQVYFGTQSQTAGSELAALVEAGNLINNGWDQTYATQSDLAGLDATEAKNYVDGYSYSTNPVVFLADLSGAPVVLFQFGKATTAYPDASKLKLELSYTSVKLGGLQTFSIEGAEWNNYVSGKSYKVPAKFVAMYDGNKPVTGTLTYDGQEIVTFSYSLESYIKANKDTEGAMGELLTAFGVFNISARAYFNTK